MRTLNNRYVLDPNTKPRKGGMSEVFRAVDMEHERRDVAIKMFRGGFAQDRLALEAYSRECKSLLALDHPNVVKILDGGTDPDSGQKYLVLEWLDLNLSDHLKGNPIGGWDDFYAQVGRPVLGALNYAFSRDIIHRDLKPQNVLVGRDGVLKVVDFGIAKFKRSIQPGLTLAGFRSEPYAPPERDDGRFSDTRDVYSFAVLALECLGGNPLLTYEDVYRALEESDVPEGVFPLLSAALARDPESRPSNIAVYYDQLESIQAKREMEWRERRICYVQIPSSVVRRICDDFPGMDENTIRRMLIEDLNEACGIKPYESGRKEEESKPKGPAQFTLVSSQYRYQAVVDRSSGDHLVLVNAVRAAASQLEVLREYSWTPQMEFRHGRPGNDLGNRQTVEWLVEGVINHEEAQRVLWKEKKREQLFRTWEKILIAKQAIDQAQERPIPYTDVTVEGNRLRFTVPCPPDDDLLGQPRYIRLQDGRVVAGEVDEVAGNVIVLWTERSVDFPIAKSGTLKFDTRANRVALQRQRYALDSVRFQRCVRGVLKDLLADPSRSAPPAPVTLTHVFQEDLDQDKRAAVEKLLGTEDFLLLEGPPGTGKTRFITEAILQSLERDPNARILLTSQTHVALDNALERVRVIAPSARLVRIGHRDDPKVAASVRPILLENKADEWLAEVSRRSDAFISEWAVSHGIDRAEIELGMAVSRLRLAIQQDQAYAGEIAVAQLEVDSLSSEVAAREAAADGATFHELQERLQQAKERLDRAKSDKRRSEALRKEGSKRLSETHELGKELSKESAEFLEAWEADFLTRDDPSRLCRKLIELVEEWRLRFGMSSDFHGALIADSQVVAGTCLGFAGARGMSNVEYAVCIVDEASKATATEILVPLSRAQKWILVGDRYQLPPFVDATLDDPTLLSEHDLSRDEVGRTLLDHLAETLPGECRQRLTHQYRMIKPIGELISQCFYEGQLVSVKGSELFDLALAFPKPVTWLSTAALSSHEEVRSKPSFKNLAEVHQVKKLLARIEFVGRMKNKVYSVAILTGYSAQRMELTRALASIQAELTHLEVACNTVDAFQGREADIAIYSVTRSNAEKKLGFLHEQRRLNVALSRGRIGLVIVGDHVFCRYVEGMNPFQRVLSHIEHETAGCAIVEADE